MTSVKRILITLCTVIVYQDGVVQIARSIQMCAMSSAMDVWVQVCTIVYNVQSTRHSTVQALVNASKAGKYRTEFKE